MMLHWFQACFSLCRRKAQGAPRVLAIRQQDQCRQRRNTAHGLLLAIALLPFPALAHPFWDNAAGWWRADASYYGSDGVARMPAFAQLTQLRVENGRVGLDESAYYPGGGKEAQAYSLGLVRPGEGVEVRSRASGPMDRTGTVVIDRADFSFGPPIRRTLEPIDATRLLYAGDLLNPPRRAYEAYWSLPAPGRRLRLLAGIDPVEVEGSPVPPGALRALATYRDVAVDDEAAERAALRATYNVKVVREGRVVDGQARNLAYRLDTPITDCDLMATDPRDPDRAVAWDGPAPSSANVLSACVAAKAAHPDVPRYGRYLTRLMGGASPAPTR